MSSTSPAGENEERLRQQWEEILMGQENQKDIPLEKVLRKLEELIEKEGIPRNYRGKLWVTMSGTHFFKEKNPDLYKSLLEHPNQEATEIIEMDLRRLKLTDYLEASSFDDQAVEAVKRILQAWATYDPSIGYVQGMAYIVAVIYFVVVIDSKIEHTEEDAFCLFARMLNSYGLRNLHSAKASTLFDYLRSFEELFQSTLPELLAHFQTERLTAETYAVECFICFFASSLNVRSLVRVWDLLFLRFPDVLPLTLLAVIYANKERLNNLPIEELIPELKRALQSIDPETLMPLIFHPPPKASLTDRCLIS